MPLKRNSEMRRLTVDLPKDVYRDLKVYCALNDTNMAEEARKLIAAFVKRKARGRAEQQ